ncbi:hypothetical protein XhhCFBP4925_01620 [Xanthomonas hortorum pv. hederae]|nr:hypothetical protein XhhCFBP4925_01620 [Xanthomonas hortorum pv. hederae]PUF00100.1 hypothetical protein C7T87_10095 [Xanthomonas hortorum pv. hederae]
MDENNTGAKIRCIGTQLNNESLFVADLHDDVASLSTEGLANVRLCLRSPGGVTRLRSQAEHA